MTAERRFGLWLCLVGAATILCALLVTLAPATPASIAGGIGLVLVLPGCAIAALVFRRGELRGHELVLCGLGISLVVGALGGLLLGGLPGDLGRTPWLIMLLAITFGALLGAAATSPRPVPGAINERTPIVIARFEDEDDDLSTKRFLPPVWNLLFAAIAVALAVGAILIARDAADESPGFTALSALPVRNDGAGPQLMISVRNEEKTDARYRLKISGGGSAAEERAFRLSPGQSKRVMVDAPPVGAGPVGVDLYRPAASRPFLRASYDPKLGATREEGR